MINESYYDSQLMISTTISNFSMNIHNIHNHFPFTPQIIMAPHKNRKSSTVSSNNNVSFSTKTYEGESIEKIICTPKYITVQELTKPAVVTDRLRRDYQDLKSFDRISMKSGVRKILGTVDVVKAVNDYWGDGNSPDSSSLLNSNDDDSLVSKGTFLKNSTWKKY